jgi:hypothetical protein
MNETSLQFHIQENDYFGTLATVLDLLRQDLNRRRYHRHAETLTRLCDDQVYLQRSHRIEKVARCGDHNRKVRRSVHLVSTQDQSHTEPRIKLLSFP